MHQRGWRLTATSKDIPGLKYFGVFLKWMVYGDVTIWIFLNSVSTISPPVDTDANIPTCRPGASKDWWWIITHTESANTVKYDFIWSVLYTTGMSLAFFHCAFLPSPVSTVAATNMYPPTSSWMFGNEFVMCTFFSVTIPLPFSTWHDVTESYGEHSIVVQPHKPAFSYTSM